MEKKHVSILTVVLSFVVLFMITIPIMAAAHAESTTADANTSNPEKIKALSEGWFAKDGDGNLHPVVLPVKDAGYKGRALTLSRVLSSEECGCGNYLVFNAFHSSVKISIDGETKYDYHTKGKFFPLAPSAYHFFRLDSSYAGKTITITLDSVASKFNGTSEMIYIGDRASAIVMIFRHNAAAIFSYTVLLAIAVLFLLIWLFIHIYSKDYHNNGLFCLALISLFMFIGGINDTRLTQFFFKNTGALCILNYEVIYFMEMAVVVYFLCSTDQRIVNANKIFAVIPAINLLSCNLLSVLKVLDLEDSLFITHICLMTLAVCEVIVNIRSKHSDNGNPDRHGFRIHPETAGFIIFAAGVCIDVIRYYAGNNTDYAACTRLGIIVFIMLLGVRSLKDYADIESIMAQSQIYRQLALHDILTGLCNRTAYQKTMSDIIANPERQLTTIVAMFDLNDLKKVNDESGHKAGDNYITESAAFINSFYKDFATLYRIGGDEFAVVCSDSINRFLSSYEEMKKKIGSADRSKINFAYGYAAYDPAFDHDIYDTAKRADHSMYKCKEQMHSANFS